MSQLIEIGDHLQLKSRFERLQQAFIASKKNSYQQRKLALEKLRTWIHANRTSIHESVFADFGKPSVEIDGTEIFHVLNEIQFALENLEQWIKPKKVDTPITMLGSRSEIRYEPRGLCLIISPWNYPFSLAVGPLVSAIAAGNFVFLKPSEMTPNVSSLLDKMVKEIFNDGSVDVAEGGPEVSQRLLALPFDHIFFTGSPAVGKLVMKAAAENLASITLELGGKSPAIVTRSGSLREAAKRIAVAKFINNGQTCVAPDYILIEDAIASSFVKELIDQLKNLFSVNGDFKASPHYCRIVNHKHFARLQELFEEAIAEGAKLEFGGAFEESSKFIHPTVLTQVSHDSRLMTEEIFGPILPIITYRQLDQAIRFVNSRPKPLALYIFSRDQKTQERILTDTSSGAVCVNDCAIQFLHHNLPFGGVSNSGIGRSHGYAGFVSFSNEKPVLRQKRGFTSIQVFYPPYTAFTKKLMDWFLKLF